MRRGGHKTRPYEVRNMRNNGLEYNGVGYMKYPLLASPMKIGTCEIKNRVVLPPMHLRKRRRGADYHRNYPGG